MDFFHTEEGVAQYEQMAEGYDGRELVERLRRHLPAGATVLELGIGPGKDLDLLLERFDAVGSDYSELFLERYRARKGAACPELLRLDAETLETERTFGAIYSNKVLVHLSREACRRSLERQVALLERGGVALHALWLGEGEQEHGGVRFVYYDRRTFSDLLPDALELLEAVVYTEIDADDSLVVVLRKRTPRA